MARNNRSMSLDRRAALPISDENPNIEFLRLSRQDICRIEINAAVRLFVFDEDPIPAHLLASAATEILTALSGDKAEVGFNDLRDFIRANNLPSELSDEIFYSAQHPYNFLKHSSSNIEVKNDFSIDYTAMIIYVSIHSYRTIFTDITPEMSVFYSALQAWRLDWWKDTPGFAEKQKVATKLNLSGASRENFCEFCRRMIGIAKERASVQTD